MASLTSAITRLHLNGVMGAAWSFENRSPVFGHRICLNGSLDLQRSLAGSLNTARTLAASLNTTRTLAGDWEGCS